jgi:hypothetical protein
MRRGILVIIILAATLSILSGAALSFVNTQNMSNPNTTGLNMINSTSDGNGTGGNAIASNTDTSAALEEGDNMGRIASVPNKCLGSALCPD